MGISVVKRPVILIICLYAILLFLVFFTLFVVIYVNQSSTVNVHWSESAISDLISIIKVLSGALVGAFSVVFADKIPENGR